MERLVFVVILLLSGNCLADSFLSGGVGVFNSAKDGYSQVKWLNMGYRQPLVLGLTEQVEFGGWLDRGRYGLKSGGYGAYLIGVETNADVMMRAMVGPAVITTPDSNLGGYFPQFTEEVFLGLSGSSGNKVGIKYKHISSAGLVSPNMGRDFAGVEMSIPW